MSSEFLELYLKPIIWTVVTLIILIIFRLILKSSARRIAKKQIKMKAEHVKWPNTLMCWFRL